MDTLFIPESLLERCHDTFLTEKQKERNLLRIQGLLDYARKDFEEKGGDLEDFQMFLSGWGLCKDINEDDQGFPSLIFEEFSDETIVVMSLQEILEQANDLYGEGFNANELFFSYSLTIYGPIDLVQKKQCNYIHTEIIPSLYFESPEPHQFH